MHNGFVRVDDEKMSKSLGNFFTIREVLKKYDAEVVRFFILRAHYRSPLNLLGCPPRRRAEHALTRLYTALKGAPHAAADEIDWSCAHAARFKAAMDDDFNTPEAIAVLFDLATEVNRSGSVHAARTSRAWGRCWVCWSVTPSPICRGAQSLDLMALERLARTGTLVTGISKAQITERIEARLRQKSQELRRGGPYPR